MVSTSGSLLLSHSSIHILIQALLPLCTLLTPNLPEAKQLLAHARRTEIKQTVSQQTEQPKLQTIKELLDAAKELSALGPQAVLVKGGHQPMEPSELQEALTAMGLTSDQQLTTSIDYQGLAIGPQVSASVKLGDEKLHCVRADGEPSLLLQRYTQSEKKVLVDVLYEASRKEYTLFVQPMISRRCTHGTGCTLSSALAVELARPQAGGSSRSIRPQVSRALQYVHDAIIRGFEDLGSGPGPLDHSVSVGPRGVPTSTAEDILTSSRSDGSVQAADAFEYYASKLDSKELGHDPTPFVRQLISSALNSWRRYVSHPFVLALADPSGFAKEGGAPPGSKEIAALPMRSFLHYLEQDFHFLQHYSKLCCLAAASAYTNEQSRLLMGMANDMLAEAEHHVQMCARFGVTRLDLQAAKEGPAVVAYTRWALNLARGDSSGLLETMTAILPCLVGYAEMGLVLERETKRRLAERDASVNLDEKARAELQDIKLWAEQYISAEYIRAAQAGIALVEQLATVEQPSKESMRRLQSVWNKGVELEAALWDECLAVGSM